MLAQRPRSPLFSRRAAAGFAVAAAALGLSGCGAGPRASSSTTVDAIVADRGVLVGASGDRAPGIRALNAREVKPIARFQSDLRSNLFGDGGETRLFAYLNGLRPLREAVLPEKDGAPDLVYAGDRIAWLVRDVSDPAAEPSAIVGLFPAPFSTRFTKRRRLVPTRVQCAAVRSPACESVERTFVRLGLRSATSNLQDTAGLDVLRIYVGSWPELRPALARGGRLTPALGIEAEAERNPFGFQLLPGGKQVRVAAPFGEAASTPPLGAGTGMVFAFRDTSNSPAWVVTGVDDAGTLAAAGALDQAQLAGRVAAVVPGRAG